MKITDALTAEHTIYLGVFDQIERTLPGLVTPAEIRTMAGIVESILQQHASRETTLAYSALDHVLAHQGTLTRFNQEHHELDARLKKVQQTNNCTEARRLLKASLAASREHFRLEEAILFPLLEKSLTAAALRDLARPWLQRQAQPTSPAA